MHRTYHKPWMLPGALVALLLGLVPAVAPVAVRGQSCSPESRPLVVLLNGTTRLQLSTRKPIKTVINPKEGILNIRTVERDPTTVLLVGQAPGITRVELEDNDGNREVREVVVQADVEYLQAQLRRVVPISSIQVIPSGSRTVILAGYVGRAEDISVVQAVARSMGFEVINGLRLNGVQQVQLDVVIARVNRNKNRSFGFNFIGNARQTIFGSTPGNILPVANFVGVPSAILQPTQFGQIINTIPGTTADIFGGIIGNAAGFIGFLQALEVEGVAKLLAQPRVVTMSGTAANILDGGQQAVPTASGLGVAGVDFRDFGTSLDFLPIVLGNGRIHLEIEPSVSTLDTAAGTIINGNVVAGRAIQRVHTSIEMETGQTFVIGGLIQRTVQATANKVPVLGQIPFLGALFSDKNIQEVETELIVMVTPHLVDPQSACQVTKVVPGQESRSPDDFELFLEGILEAPRGPRQVFQGHRYVPAHLTGPAADLFPCAGRCDPSASQPHAPVATGAVGGCASGNCAGSPAAVTHTVGHGAPAALPASMPAPAGNPPAASVAAPAAEPQQPGVPAGVEATVSPEPAAPAPAAGEPTKAEPVGPPVSVPPPPPAGTAPPAAPGEGQP
jgi:pilus assembly protein CpaC